MKYPGGYQIIDFGGAGCSVGGSAVEVSLDPELWSIVLKGRKAIYITNYQIDGEYRGITLMTPRFSSETEVSDYIGTCDIGVSIILDLSGLPRYVRIRAIENAQP